MDPRLTGLDLKTSLSAIVDLVLPRVCVVCGRTLLQQVNARIAGEEYEPYAYAAALFYYAADSDYSRITQALKYHRDFGAGKFFARMLGKRLGESGLFDDVDLIVPVPLHWTRLWTRGYNQAEVIARELAATLSAPCRTDLLRRCRRTATQTRLSGEEKSANVAGAFRATKKAVSLASGDGISHILLVDDVFTSGATMGECCKTLRPAFGAQTRISAASLGYAGY